MAAFAGLFLLLILAAIAVQYIVLHRVPVPGAADAGILAAPSSPIPEISGTTGNVTSPYPLPLDLSNTSNRSAPEVPVINASSLEARVHMLVNQVREEHGLPALGMDAALSSLARAHSRDMAENRYFGHVNLDERDATARGAAVGYSCHKAADPYYSHAIAENLFATERYPEGLVRDGRAVEYRWVREEAIAEETVDAWMNSPDHRVNILDPGVGREGIGVAIAEYDLVFVTEDLC
jgi:uncharacterized protein YkwD